jgi:hypothetical protein
MIRVESVLQPLPYESRDPCGSQSRLTRPKKHSALVLPHSVCLKTREEKREEAFPKRVSFRERVNTLSPYAHKVKVGGRGDMNMDRDMNGC